MDFDQKRSKVPLGSRLITAEQDFLVDFDQQRSKVPLGSLLVTAEQDFLDV